MKCETMTWLLLASSCIPSTCLDCVTPRAARSHARARPIHDARGKITAKPCRGLAHLVREPNCCTGCCLSLHRWDVCLRYTVVSKCFPHTAVQLHQQFLPRVGEDCWLCPHGDQLLCQSPQGVLQRQAEVQEVDALPARTKTRRIKRCIGRQDG